VSTSTASPAAPAAGEAGTAGEAEPELLGIREAARRAGCSERALRYYQQMGLVTPAARTPGGLRRYSIGDLARVARLRELQDLLGLNLDEIRAVFAREDRLEEIRAAYRLTESGDPRRKELVAEAVGHYEELRSTVEAKLRGLQGFLDDLDGAIHRARELLDGPACC
jgi:DNA-binding transcriptional MerR regulator